MDNTSHTHTIENKELVVRMTDLPVNAGGSVVVEMEGTVVLVTATMSGKNSPLDYFPLTVDFEERFYATGKILGSRFMRREGRPSLNAVLSGRMIDRTIRPLFPEGFKKEVQVVITVLALGEQDPAPLGIVGASLALDLSSIPWNGPVGVIPFCLKNGIWEAFPSLEEATNADGKSVVCEYDGKILMVEMEGREIDVEIGKKLFTDNLEILASLREFQMQIKNACGKEKELFVTPIVAEEKFFESTITPALENALYTNSSSLDDLKETWINHIAERGEDKTVAQSYFEKQVSAFVHKKVVVEGKRLDGRDTETIRDLYAQAGGISEKLHGVGIFHRGDTRVLGVLTLGAPNDSLLENSMLTPESKESFFLHYNFPPFASGETGRIGTPNRRMLGHGALAEKALRYVLPSKFLYTIRLVTECLASNGSTSMASVCAGTLALMDGGVPISRPVVGIAIGVMEHGGEYKTIVDIQGKEDGYGGMDFKIAGTEKGITALQMDTKLAGVPVAMMCEALDKACVAHIYILRTMHTTIEKPRESFSPSVPLLEQMKVPEKKIGKVIGSGGKTIQGLEEESGASVNIDDDGTITLGGTQESIDSAREKIKALTHEFKAGDMVEGKVVNIKDFGAFVALNDSTDGLVHISEISSGRINSISDVLSVGDMVEVVVKERTREGKISLALKTPFQGSKNVDGGSFSSGRKRNDGRGGGDDKRNSGTRRSFGNRSDGDTKKGSFGRRGSGRDYRNRR